MAQQAAMNDAIVDFANSKAGETDIREAAWGRVQGVQSLLDKVDKLIQDGKLADMKTDVAPEKTGPQETN
jgi:hypothetical protein